jgi:hypothetical protein
LSSRCVHSWYSCNRARTSLRRRNVLGRHGCTMQPPASHQHECTTTQGNPSGLLMFGK